MTTTQATTTLTYEDALEDVHTRFLLNLPAEEFNTADRILFQIEQAWWFYEDWICDQMGDDCPLPRFKQLRSFALKMFEYSPLLNEAQFPSLWEKFRNYRRKISTYGTILLSEDCSKVILCQEWHSKAWTFPAGKINQGESGLDAAARETYEETGFDPNGLYGLTHQLMANKDSSSNGVTWQPLEEKNALTFVEEGGKGKRRTFYICRGAPEDFPFAPVARKEIWKVAWHPLDDIPRRSYAIGPFLPRIRTWIKSNVHGKTPKKELDNDKNNQLSKEQQKKNSSGRDRSAGRRKQGSRPRSRTKTVQHDDPLTETGLAMAGESSGWSEDAMFQANERLLGRKVEYDGNPHVFSEQGFQGKDPHSFHVVGGAFMNSNTDTLAPPPESSRLQHLFRVEKQPPRSRSVSAGSSFVEGDDRETLDDVDELLTPFFSGEGATPWGEVVDEAKELQPRASSRQSGGIKKKAAKHRKPHQPPQQGSVAATMLATDDGGDTDLVFMTDVEITARSQKEKLAQFYSTTTLQEDERLARKEARQAQYEQDQQYIQQWVANLPRAQPTPHFGDFRFNVDQLMEALYQHY